MFNVLRIFVPAVAEAICRLLFETLNVIFISRTGGSAEMVAAVGVGNTTVNMIAYAFLWGIASSLDTLASRAIGAKNFK